MANIPSVEDFNSSAQFKVAQWSRNTVADGVWLQKNTIGPLKERDDFILSLLNDLGNSDSWKQWSENHNSTSEYPDIASAIYLGPNNEILGSGHAYVVGENNRVVATTNTATYSRGGSYVFGMDNYVNDGFVIGNQVTALQGSKVFGRDVSANKCSTVIGYNASADNGSLIISTPASQSDSKKIADNGSLLLAMATGKTSATAIGGSILISKNSNIAKGGSFVIGESTSADGGSILVGRNISANGASVIVGSNAKATEGALILKHADMGGYSYANGGIVIGDYATAYNGALAMSLNYNFGGDYASHDGIVIGDIASADFGAVVINATNNNKASATTCGIIINAGETNKDRYSVAHGCGIVLGGGSAQYCGAIIGKNNYASNCAFAFGDGNTVKANFAFGINNSAVASTLENYYILSAERDSDGNPILTGTTAATSVSSKVYEPHGFIAGDNNISQTYSPIIIGVANSAALSGGFGELANYDTTGYMVPNYPIAIGIGNKAYRNFDTTIGSYNVADGGSNLIFGDWCSAFGTRNTILNGYNSSIMGMDNFIFGSKSNILIYDEDGKPVTGRKTPYEYVARNMLFWSNISAFDNTNINATWVCENNLRKSNINFSAYNVTAFVTENVLNNTNVNVKHSGETFFSTNQITGGKIDILTNAYTMFNYNKIRLGNKNDENTLNIKRNGQSFILNNNIDYAGHNGKTFNIDAWMVSFNNFKYNRTIPLDPATNIFNINTGNGIYTYDSIITENNIYQSIFDINLGNIKSNYNTTKYITTNNLLYTKYICDFDKHKEYALPRYYITSEYHSNTDTTTYTEKLDKYEFVFGNSFVFGGSILNSDRVISFATECSLTGDNNEYTTISNSKNIINLGDDNEISASIETISFGKTNNIVGGHKTTIFGNENIAYITPVEVDSLVTDLESYKHYSGMLPGLYDTNIIGSYNSFMSDVEFDPNEDKYANTIARNFILGYHNDIKVHNFITDNVIIGNNNKTVYEPNDYSDQLYRNKIIGNNNSASNQFADCNILGDSNELNNDSEIVFENDTIIGMHNKVEFGSNSTLIGHHNIVSGYNSILIGEGLSATNSQVVVGRFNEVLPGTDDRDGQTTTSGALFIVGNGSHTDDDFDNPTRSNAMVVSADGTVSARTYKAAPNTTLGKLFDFLNNTSTTGTLKWDGTDWSFV